MPTCTVRASGAAAGSSAIMVSTVGAALKWVTPSSVRCRQIVAVSIVRKQTWVPPTAVTAQVKHQPSQWNIGSVHRYFDPGRRPESYAIATD